MKAAVSVIIPTYKGANNLPRAIGSVLDQTFKSIELIIVDDNDPLSEERSETILAVNKFKSEKVRYVQHERNKNGATARNTGIFHCVGKYICFLDDDDFYLPDRILKSVEALEANPAFAAVYGGVIIANGRCIEEVITADKPLEPKDLLLNEMALGTGSNLFLTREAVLNLGGFDEAFKRHQDLEFMLRFLERYRVLNLKELIIVKATNGTNNVPDYIGLREVKGLYFKKFHHVINRLAEQEYQAFFKGQYEQLFISAVMSKNRRHVEMSRKELERLRKLTLKDKLFISLAGGNLPKTRLYKIVRPFYNAMKSRLVSIRLHRLIDTASRAYLHGTLANKRAVVSNLPDETAVNYGSRFLRVK